MGKSKTKKTANGSSGTRTTSEKSGEIQQALFKHLGPIFQWESLFAQKHSLEDLNKMVTTKPQEFKRCKLDIKRPDLAYAKPLNDSTAVICISGSGHVGRSFPGDEVCVQILSRELSPHHCESLTGKVVGLMGRSEERCTFICRTEGRKQLVTPVRNNMTHICIIQKKPDKVEIRTQNPYNGYWFSKDNVDLAEDQLLVVKVLRWDKNRRYPLGVVTKVISNKEYLNECLKIECCVSDTPPSSQSRFDQQNMEKRDKFDKYGGKTFTIDSPTAQDLDDAFSVCSLGEQYMVAIHITDVASHVRKDSEEDKFARKQGRTFYYPHEMKADPVFMLCRDTSRNYLSLLPGEERKAISLLIKINKTTSMIASSSFVLSHIKSDKRLTYEDVNEIIKAYQLDGNEAPLEFSSVENCVAVAYCFSKVLRKFRLEGSWSSEQRNGDSRAKCMVEELMNFYNNAVAEELLSNDITRDRTPLRCHSKPDPILLEQFKTKYSRYLAFSPYFAQRCDVSEAEFEEIKGKEPFIHVLTPVFDEMKTLAKTGDYHKLVHLISSDAIHPTLRHMGNEFKEIQPKAVILRSCSNLPSKLGHYDLQLNAYTWASSPMRRYLDLILQRLLHIVLSEKQQLQMGYTIADIDEFCEQSDCTEDLAFECLQFLGSTQSCSSNMTKLAIVGQLSPKDHEFSISFPFDGMPPLTIEYRNLKVVEQPAYNRQDNSCTLKWRRRVYSFNNTNSSLPQSETYKNITSISCKNWSKLISTVQDEDWEKVRECIKDLKGEKVDVKPVLKSHEEHFKEWDMELKLAEVLQVQIGTELINEAKRPAVRLLSVNAAFEVCLEHARNPIKCFTTTDEVCHASKIIYSDYKEYQDIWSKLCQMDTAYNAVEENNSVILEGVNITWVEITPTMLKGHFKMTQEQQKTWSLEFDLTNCYLCIRLRDQRADKDTKGTQCNGTYSLSYLQNKLPFTWVAHGVPIKSEPKKESKKKKTSKKSVIQINFQINRQHMTSYPVSLAKEETKFTVEVIPKKIPYVQYEHAIDNIKYANDLVKSIATGSDLNTFRKPEERNAGKLHMDNSLSLPPLNTSQENAVRKALKNPFTVIQGPPGTGKTVVGVYITYNFHMKNTLKQDCPIQPPRLEQDAAQEKKTQKKRGILYCGPSNKSVDIVAGNLSQSSIRVALPITWLFLCNISQGLGGNEELEGRFETP